MCTIANLANELQARIDLYASVFREQDYKAMSDLLKNIISEAELAASKPSKGKNPEMLYFTGLEWASKPEDERPDTIDISVQRGESEPFLKFTVDYTMLNVVHKGMCVYQLGKLDPASKHFKDALRMIIRKLAEKEEKEPGSFAKTAYPRINARVRKPLETSESQKPKYDLNLANKVKSMVFDEK